MSLLPVLDKCPDCAGRGWTAKDGQWGWCVRCDGYCFTLIQKKEAL